VTLALEPGRLRLAVRDDGRGPPDVSPDRLERDRHMGLAGMRERIGALGGSVRFGRGRDAGASLEVLLPVVPEEAP